MLYYVLVENIDGYVSCVSANFPKDEAEQSKLSVEKYWGKHAKRVWIEEKDVAEKLLDEQADKILEKFRR